ncbi:L,D-transpeptidase family protein [uncultured Maritalea sp.]|jgi:murein L,D-transpeptidase YafK|uniref:L,D-transpeptidase family protein n=1 Tax=uncultured Maritalea sp. TaxID=757249 RepID=UPI00345DB317
MLFGRDLHLESLVLIGLRQFTKLSLIVLAIGLLGACTTGFESNRHNIPLSSLTKARLSQMGSSEKAPMLVRIFKRDSELEVWKKVEKTGKFEHFRTYKICAWSGDLGPKIKEGDRQSPEGFYDVTPGLMNPRSNYFLAFNLGFPNKFDRAHGRTGSNIMVHGDCSSRGCYAMTDEQVGEIYALARETFKGGSKSFQVQVFPFRMTAENLAEFSDSKHMSFWRDIKVGYDHFELTKERPKWEVCNGRYGINRAGGCGASTLNADMKAAYSQMQTADAAAFEVAMANKAQSEKDAAAAAQRKIEAAQAAEERKIAVNQTTQKVTSWFGGLFGAVEQTEGGEDANAPVPPPRQ